MRPRRGAVVGTLSVAIFTQCPSFPAIRSPSIPRSGSVETGTSRVASCGALRTCVTPLPHSPTGFLKPCSLPIHPMTLIQRTNGTKVEAMEATHNKEDGSKPLRPVRNRRYTRRSLVGGQRPQKRLFTPEIKRYLKDWLVRRRENPYPNREEKKCLAHETGLTYIQICNWFANWRRKLKNVNADRSQPTWGHLIRTYNDRAQGNVEQFSICSEDSIWSEPDPRQHDVLDADADLTDGSPDHTLYQHEDSDTSSTSKDKFENLNNNSYTVESANSNGEDNKTITSPLLLSKWLESAARFQPSESNYSCWADGRRRKAEHKPQKVALNSRHDRDEVEAAMALTTLATATNRLLTP